MNTMSMNILTKIRSEKEGGWGWGFANADRADKGGRGGWGNADNG